MDRGDKLLALLDAGQREQALSLALALGEGAVLDRLLERVAPVPVSWHGEALRGFDGDPLLELQVASGRALGGGEAMLLSRQVVDELPWTPRTLVLEQCVVRRFPRGVERLVLAACAVECALEPVEELELHWPQEPVPALPEGCGHLILTAWPGSAPLRIAARRATLLWAHNLERLDLDVEQAELVDCERLVHLEGRGALSTVRLPHRADRFAHLGEPLPEEAEACLHRSWGTSWPRWVGWGPEALLALGARWIADWSDTEQQLRDKQPAWESLLATFREHPAAPRAAAASYLACFQRTRPLAERFLNRVFWSPWGIAETSFGPRGVQALRELAEHPRCLHRDLVERALEGLGDRRGG